jgi:hypothetical protein
VTVVADRLAAALLAVLIVGGLGGLAWLGAS